ncbi:hypothetical protein DCC81_11660 [Chitinophaga parva]|uniref:Kinase n=1 Tax=Chitinophaga parva TaxID=2169414 RepID=A0A2T7BJE8_9BACT|nr:AAA family ATPase [Chitinophaga parva]PUZ26384.1 hypothetical protein DCC81_11660 [Chitinophaga parva]
MIIIVTGLPSSGKSYFASHLSALINAVYINSDQVRKRLFIRRTYSEAEKLSVYAHMLREMKDAVRQHKDVVMDATFYKKSIRENFLRQAGGTETVAFIEIKADEALIKDRLKQARTDSEADFEVYQKIKEQWEPLEEPHLTLQSTNKNIDSMLAQAGDYLNITINDQGTDR